MFTNFFYHLKSTGIPVSFNEWNSFIDALEMGLHHSSLTGFYNLCRAVLIKSEAYYDRFDLAFVEYFGEIETPESIPEKVWEWLDKNLPEKKINKKLLDIQEKLSLEELERMLKERLEEQTEEHHGGNYWIGTGGTSPFGHSGYHPDGIRIGGESRNRSAIKVAAERKYQSYRTDETLDTRQFQLALKKLRNLTSKNDGARTELDIDGTINKTCNNAGRLELVWDRPRENAIKVLLLMDAGGSMNYYNKLCRQLFQAVNNSTHFKDLQMFYFHNCIYEQVFGDSLHYYGYEYIDTEHLLRTFDKDYRLIIVGDAEMNPNELMNPGGIKFWGMYNEVAGIDWLKKIRKHFEYSVWLNPVQKEHWDYTTGAYTINKIADIFPMDELTVAGLERSIDKLKSKKGSKLSL